MSIPSDISSQKFWCSLHSYLWNNRCIYSAIKLSSVSEFQLLENEIQLMDLQKYQAQVLLQ